MMILLSLDGLMEDFLLLEELFVYSIGRLLVLLDQVKVLKIAAIVRWHAHVLQILGQHLHVEIIIRVLLHLPCISLRLDELIARWPKLTNLRV